MKLEESFLYSEVIGGVKYFVLMYDMDGFYVLKAHRVLIYDIETLPGFHVLDKLIADTARLKREAAKSFLEATLAAR